MLQKILDYFTDEEDTDPSFIALTRNILIFVVVSNLALLPLVTDLAGESAQNPLAFGVLVGTLILEGISLYYVFREKVRMAKVVVPIALLVAATIIALNTNGLKSTDRKSVV